MPSKSKIKGSTFERDVAKMFNEIYETNEFSRTFGSGAFVGKSNWDKRKGLSEEVKTALAGDIITPKWFPLSIECKNYDDTPAYHNLLTEDGDATLNTWLGKSIYDAVNTNMIPCVCFKTTRKGSFIVLPYIVLDELNLECNYLRYGCFIIVSIDNYKKEIAKPLLDILKDENSAFKTAITAFFTEQMKITDSYVFSLVTRFKNAN